jgi:hypothetical protein
MRMLKERVRKQDAQKACTMRGGSMGVKVPEWYLEVTEIAKSYYDLLKQRADIEREILLCSSGPADGMPRNPEPGDPTARKAEQLIHKKGNLDMQITAIQKALDELYDDCERQLIRKNLFQRIPMHWINLPMPIITMKRVRRRFLRNAARKMGIIPAK